LVTVNNVPTWLTLEAGERDGAVPDRDLNELPKITVVWDAVPTATITLSPALIAIASSGVMVLEVIDCHAGPPTRSSARSSTAA
jgi:hypothetical protein